MTTLTDAEDRITHLEDGLTGVRSELADVRVEVERVRSQVTSVLVEVERVRSEMALMEARILRWMVGIMIGLVAATAAVFGAAVAVLKLLGV